MDNRNLQFFMLMLIARFSYFLIGFITAPASPLPQNTLLKNPELESGIGTRFSVQFCHPFYFPALMRVLNHFCPEIAGRIFPEILLYFPHDLLYSRRLVFVFIDDHSQIPWNRGNDGNLTCFFRIIWQSWLRKNGYSMILFHQSPDDGNT